MNEEVKAQSYQLAEQDYKDGMKYREIAEKYHVTINTVKSWKTRHGWTKDGKKGMHTKQKKGCIRKGGQPGNKNAAGHGAPKQNKNAEKYGFFSKYLPDETREIFFAIEQANPLDLLWHQIQIAYAAIIRAQRIAYVKDGEDKTIGGGWGIQQAWDKQNAFLKAQARAQSELRSMIKQYDEMIHKDWEAASEEQKVRLEQIRAKTELLKHPDGPDREDGVVIVNDAPKAGSGIGSYHPEISADF